MYIKKSLLIISSAILLTSAANTFAAPEKHKVIVPTCLLNTASVQFNKLAQKNDLQLIEVDKAGIVKLAEAKHRAKGICGGFMDVTREWNEDSKMRKTDATGFLVKQTTKPSLHSRADEPAYKIKYQKQTEELLKTINPSLMWDNLTTLTSFDDRYAGSENGVNAAKWIKEKIESIASATGHDDVTVYYVKTGSWDQPSVVAKFGKSNEPGIVIGGHMDTLDSYNSPKPGADDDGSGSVTVMETARTLLSSGTSFNKPIYFIWYSAEEMGLIGSGYVVADFKKKKIPVAAVLQLDMTGYEYQNQSTMWLITDHVNKDLTNFLKELITTYVKQPVKTSMCGYGCSDHASWDKAGFPAAFPFETEMNKDNPDIHTSNDKMDRLSLSHMTDFAKLGTAFAVELAEPTAK